MAFRGIFPFRNRNLPPPRGPCPGLACVLILQREATRGHRSMRPALGCKIKDDLISHEHSYVSMIESAVGRSPSR
jgi:hypothetical protein